MIFTYTYRLPSGAKRRSAIEADSRADCFVRLTARGIKPLSVVEGGRLADAVSSVPAGGKPWLKGLAAVLMLAVLAVIAYVVFSKNGEGDVDDIHRPASSSRTKPSTVKPVAVKPKQPSSVQVSRSGQRKAPAAAQSAESNDSSSTNRFVRADIPEPKPLEELTPPPRPAFSTSAEQLLAMATPPDPSQPVPPLPNLEGEDNKEELEKALNNVIVPTTNDTIGSLQMKMNVAEQKEEFRKLRAEAGWTFKEYLTALREKHNEDAQYIAEAHRVNEENYSNPEMTDEEYLRQRKLINDALRERGLPELE